MYLIKRYVKKYPQPKFPVEKNQKCSECQKVQRKHKISFCFNTLLPLSCKSSKQICLPYCFGSRGEEGINYLLQINRKVSILVRPRYVKGMYSQKNRYALGMYFPKMMGWNGKIKIICYSFKVILSIYAKVSIVKTQYIFQFSCCKVFAQINTKSYFRK